MFHHDIPRQELFTDLLLRMENPTMDSMGFGVPDPNLATFEAFGRDSSSPRCVSSDTDLLSGDGELGTVAENPRKGSLVKLAC